MEQERIFTEKEYKLYMCMVRDLIQRAEQVVIELPKWTEVYRLTFEEWVDYQKGQSKI